MSRNQHGSGDWQARFALLCDQLVHPSVTAEPLRGQHRRLLGVALAAPFLLGATLVQVMAPTAGLSVAVAAVCAVFVAGWTVAVAVAQTGSDRVAAPAALIATALCVALVMHHAGGAHSPLLLSWLPLVIEPWFVRRSRAARMAGLGAILLGLAFWSALAAGGPALEPVAPAAWHWLVPIVYGATLWARRDVLWPAERLDTPQTQADDLADLLPSLVLRYGADGQVVDASARARVMLCVEPEFLLGSGLGDRVHVADRVAYLSALADMRSGALARAVELRLRVPSDDVAAGSFYRPFVLELAGTPTRDGFAGFLRDNGELEGLRQDLAEATAANEAAKARFLATVSHELRTPLNAIIGFSDMLLHEMMGPFANERQRDYVGLVRESGQHLLAVVNSMLDMSRLEAGTYPVAPSAFVFEEALDVSRSIVSYQARSKGIDIAAETVPVIGTVNADRRAMQQILINLLSNAVKFTPEGGSVVTGARRERGRLTFWVSDNGIGIAQEDLGRIGRPFVQLINDHTRHYEGTGLGLALVKKLVELQKGAMTIESAPGLGTTVTIVIPLDDYKAADHGAETEIYPIPAKAGPKEHLHDAIRKSA